MDQLLLRKKERLSTIIHAAGTLATVLTAGDIAPDTVLFRPESRLKTTGFMGRRSSYELTSTLFAKGWNLQLVIGSPMTLGRDEQPTRDVRGLLLADTGEVIGYQSSFRDTPFSQDAIRINERWPGTKIINSSSMEEYRSQDIDNWGGLEKVEEGLVNLAIKHSVDPKIFE